MANRNPNSLIDRIERDSYLLMDGALGTELERRGVPFESSGWSAFAVRDYGNIIREIHQDYICSSAKLHIANSFALARHVLEPIGLGSEFETLNQRAVELFFEAVDQSKVDRNELWLAGSLSTFSANSDRSSLPSIEVLEKNCRDQAQVLFDSGIDLFALEMLFDLSISKAMINAVEDFGLPIIIGFTCDWDEFDDKKVVAARGMGCPPIDLSETLLAIINDIASTNVIMSIMHSELDVTDAGLELLKKFWDGPIAIYPNSGQFIDLQMQFDTISPVSEFHYAAKRWINAGVQIVGGCCGIGPEHISSLGVQNRR